MIAALRQVLHAILPIDVPELDQFADLVGLGRLGHGDEHDRSGAASRAGQASPMRF